MLFIKASEMHRQSLNLDNVVLHYIESNDILEFIENAISRHCILYIWLNLESNDWGSYSFDQHNAIFSNSSVYFLLSNDYIGSHGTYIMQYIQYVESHNCIGSHWTSIMQCKSTVWVVLLYPNECDCPA